MTVRSITALLLFVTAGAVSGAQLSRQTAPESFHANGQITSTAGGAASALDIQIDRYTTDAEHNAMVDVLKGGGNDAFVAGLKKAPSIGSVKIGPRSVAVRWARERPQGQSRRIVVVTDEPIFFAGAGAANAKPTAGYDIAVIEFTVDSIGLGKGTMAPGARVKPGGPTGVDVQDYSGQRVTLATVRRNAQ